MITLQTVNSRNAIGEIIATCCAVFVCLALAPGCRPASHAKITPPDRRASFDANYKAVGVLVKKKFPEVVSQDEYNAWNGYMMPFRVRHGTSKAEEKKIMDYAYPLWVQIREWNGMSKSQAEGCNVPIFENK